MNDSDDREKKRAKSSTHSSPTRNLEEDFAAVRAAALGWSRSARDVASNVPSDETITVRDPVTDTEVIVHRSKVDVVQRALEAVVVLAED